MSTPSYDLKISLDTLEADAIRQVEMIGRATRLAAELKRTHAEAKNALDLVEAKLKRAIRSNPEKYGVPNGKTTEGSINEAMVAHPDYQSAERAVIEAKYQLDLIDGVLTSLDHRKRMIETEVELWKSSYFAKPNIQAGGMPSEGGIREAIQTAHKRTVRSKVKPLQRS